jgi:hypothetical protein
MVDRNRQETRHRKISRKDAKAQRKDRDEKIAARERKQRRKKEFKEFRISISKQPQYRLTQVFFGMAVFKIAQI